jgi:hypothetical protein
MQDVAIVQADHAIPFPAHGRDGEAAFRRALELNPSYAYARDQFGMGLAFQGKLEEAIAEDREQALDKHAIGLFEDLLDFALTRVDWWEIATHYVDESIRKEHKLRSAGAAICQALEVAVKEVSK